MREQKIWYSVDDSGHDVESRNVLEIDDSFDLMQLRDQERLAELCAADYYNECDGWECLGLGGALCGCIRRRHYHCAG